MRSLNARFQLMALLAIAVMLVLLPMAVAAALDPAALDLDGRPIPKRAPVHHVAPTEHQRDIDRLKAEVQKLRAQAEMCEARKTDAK